MSELQSMGGPDVARVVELPSRLIGIDLVRGIAAGVVMVSHAILAVTVYSPNWNESAPVEQRELILTWMGGLGAWGVGLFFVLSGLCIHLPMARRLVANPESKLDLNRYFRRRFTRIYPPHLVALVLSVLAAFALPGWYISQTLLSIPTWTQFAAHLAMVHTFVPGAMYSINSVLWTIALETHFYLLYPLLLLALRRVSGVAIVAALFVLSASTRYWIRGRLSPEWAEIVDQSVLRRYWEWCLGLALAGYMVRARYRQGFTANATAVVLATTYAIGMLLLAVPFGSSLRGVVWPLLFALAIYGSMRIAPPSEVVSRVGGWLGKTSYSLYLTHPIAIAMVVFLVRAAHLPSWVGAVGGVLASLLVTRIFYRLVERPFLERSAAARVE